MSFPELDKSIEVLPGTDVEGEWDRFEVFEALHHTMSICSPLTSAQLDEGVDALVASGGTRALDVACGYGEVMFRLIDHANGTQRDIEATGIDLSPWMLRTANQRANARSPRISVHWILGDASRFLPDEPHDLAICTGAEWVWHGFNGTARALAERVGPGGRVMIGAARLHEAADPAEVAEKWGRVETTDDMAEMLDDHGLRPVHRVDPNDADWDAYLDQTALAAEQWAQQYPGERAEKWLQEQTDWRQARERDRSIIGWSLWVAEKRQSRA